MIKFKAEVLRETYKGQFEAIEVEVEALGFMQAIGKAMDAAQAVGNKGLFKGGMWNLVSLTKVEHEVDYQAAKAFQEVEAIRATIIRGPLLYTSAADVAGSANPVGG